MDAETGSDVNFSFRVNQSGNGDGSDNCYVFHSIDDGELVLDTAWVGGGSPAVYDLNDGLDGLAFGHYIRFYVAMQTNSKTEFWAIMGGEIQISDGDETQSLISVWFGRPPAPPETDPFLPVTLTNFSGKVDNGVVVLKWATASEINNDFFSIEKSEDGVFFEVIGVVDGAGNTNSLMEYGFTDETPIKLAYYRLKQTDYDGAFTYSSIIKVSEELCGTNEIEIASSNGTINVLTNSTISGKLDVSIYTLSGTLVFSSSHRIESGCSTLRLSPDISGNSIYLVSACLNAQKPVNSKVYVN